MFIQVRVVLKYRHCDGNLCIKVTDDAVVSLSSFCSSYVWSFSQIMLKVCLFQCLQYKTDQAQDVRKIEKLHGKLMRLMVSKESHSGAMETDWIHSWTFEQLLSTQTIFKSPRSTGRSRRLLDVYRPKIRHFWKERAAGTADVCVRDEVGSKWNCSTVVLVLFYLQYLLFHVWRRRALFALISWIYGLKQDLFNVLKTDWKDVST